MMKKNLLKVAFGLLAILLTLPLTSCSDSDDEVKSYVMSIKLTLPTEVAEDNIENVQLIISKNNHADTIKLGSQLSYGLTLPQGQYTIQATGKVIDEAQAYVTGQTTVDLYADATTTISLSKYTQSPLIFKSLYTTGGRQGYMKDGYFEIVNNSDEVQYLDNLILFAGPTGQAQANAWQAEGITDIYPSGQGAVVAFPGNGTDYPLQPGQSVLVAQDAADHTQLDPNGIHSDLSNADFEIYLDYVGSEIDYPATNMKVLWTNNKHMAAFGLGFFSRSYILAKLPTGMTPEEFAADSTNFQTTPNTTSTSLFMMMPSKYVLDAVEIWDASSDVHYSVFLPKDDAQGVFGSTVWTGKCIRRKVSKIVNGRVYYQDTNNSSKDFLNNQPQTPGVTPTAVDK